MRSMPQGWFPWYAYHAKSHTTKLAAILVEFLLLYPHHPELNPLLKRRHPTWAHAVELVVIHKHLMVHASARMRAVVAAYGGLPTIGHG